MKVSIVIRTRNEERWISSCLKAVYSQDCQDFEVILVDNESTDSTLDKVRQFPVKKILSCTDYLPGKALNIGFAAAEGEYVVCLSGHCIPTSPSWLQNLMSGFNSAPKVAGVYGRQQPLAFTSPWDKRDLMVIFGPERKIQHRDSFFHNANSMLLRQCWQDHPFDEETTNIEDRIWAKQVQDDGYCLVYEPDASVYHHHGIHQDGNMARCNNVVRILEGLLDDPSERESKKSISKSTHTVCLIPLKGPSLKMGGVSLLKRTILTAQKCRRLNEIVLSTDNEENIHEATSLGVQHIIRRNEDLSADYVGLEEVYAYSIEQLQLQGILPEVVVLLETTYPFRNPKMIDQMVDKLVSEGLDTVLPAKQEHNAVWKGEQGNLEQVDEGPIPRQYKKPMYLSYKGLCCVTRPEFLRNQQLVGTKTGIHTFKDFYSTIEIRHEEDIQQVQSLLGLLQAQLS